jgi:hypothetical protein
MKIDSIMKKWKPSKIVEKRRISISSEPSYTSKRQATSKEFLQTISKISSPRYTTERKQTIGA